MGTSVKLITQLEIIIPSCLLFLISSLHFPFDKGYYGFTLLEVCPCWIFQLTSSRRSKIQYTCKNSNPSSRISPNSNHTSRGLEAGICYSNGCIPLPRVLQRELSKPEQGGMEHHYRSAEKVVRNAKAEDCDAKNEKRPTVTVTVSGDDFFDIANEKPNSQAFMGGKLEVKRNVMLRQELQTILEKKRKSKLQLLTLQIR
ncbi:hypothetical protein RB195_008072 [Necator americanus]|uniref:SCP2 domain-containing protein n=1 Tax=Necator americanus TaxID=51031 RepID=A0ABR1C0A6_NECAM